MLRITFIHNKDPAGCFLVLLEGTFLIVTFHPQSANARLVKKTTIFFQNPTFPSFLFSKILVIPNGYLLGITGKETKIKPYQSLHR